MRIMIRLAEPKTQAEEQQQIIAKVSSATNNPTQAYAEIDGKSYLIEVYPS